MPLLQKNKQKGKASKNKKSSTVKRMFKRYNKNGISFEGVKKFFAAVFYRIGYAAELETIIIYKVISNWIYRIYRLIKKILKEISIFLGRMFDTVFEDIGAPLSRIKAAVFNIIDIIAKSKKDKTVKPIKEIKAYVKQGLKKHKSSLPDLASYALPLLSFIMLVVVVNIGLAGYVAIKVNINGENIGYVKNYSVVENADKVIKNKLVVSNENQKWSITPKITMVSTLGKSFDDERQLADKILKASDENIVEATGLYVDNKFYGAVKNAAKLKENLKSVLAPYQSDDPNKTVTFLQDVSVLDGVFFTDSVVDDQKLADMVVNEVEGEKYYTAVKGDSPSLIAAKNNITLKQLYALNVGRPGGEGQDLHIGDSILVGQAVPFLQVKTIERISYPVSVPFKTVYKQNNTMSLGQTKVTKKGVNGENLVTADRVYIDGILASETVIKTDVVSEPVNQEEDKGTLIPNTNIISNVQGSGRLIWPTAGGVRVSRGFSGQFPGYHNGVDIAGPIGTTIFAADSGTVIKAAYTYVGYGVHIIIDHGNGMQTLYGHCSSLNVSFGQKVEKGQAIARMGSTGNSTGSHLHFEVKYGETRYNPYNYF